MELSGRSILITGASGGIGRPTAELLAREGAKLTLFARSAAPLESLRATIESRGGTAIAVAGDVRSVSDAERAVAEAVRRFGGLDAVVNNAGIGLLESVAEASDEKIAELLEVNVLGTIRVTRAALSALKARATPGDRRGGSVVLNVASFAGKVGVPYYSFYNASKFALVGLTEAWRRELGPQGIRVVLVIPAAVETEFLAGLDRGRALGLGPAGTVLKPDEVARAIVDALRRPRPEVYIPRRNRWMGLLNAVSPRLADRIVNRLFRYPARPA
ncbi:MAG TPA: SDR family oxidoreductase [Candidatus Limnocylindrales bacterium]|nr:SDR family oxidoreductase [Candidatus Limnocylindrales bacterium]